MQEMSQTGDDSIFAHREGRTQNNRPTYRSNQFGRFSIPNMS